MKQLPAVNIPDVPDGESRERLYFDPFSGATLYVMTRVTKTSALRLYEVRDGELCQLGEGNRPSKLEEACLPRGWW